MRKPNTGMIDDILMKCKDTVMRGMNFSQLKGCSLMVGDASGLPGQFSDSDKVCAENAGVDYMDVIQFVGKDLDLNYVLSKEHTSEGLVEFRDDFVYIFSNPYGVDLNIKIELQDIYRSELVTPPICKPPLFTLKVRIKKDQDYGGYSDIIRIDKGDNNNSKAVTVSVPYGGCKLNPNTGFLIWFINKKIIDFETVCHEASHVSTEAFNFLGEEVKNSEPFSYLNGWIERKCEEVKIGIAEDKLIWESK